MSETNPTADQAEYWNGRAGDRWVTWQDFMDRSLDGFGREVLRRAHVQTGERVLDVGCGCGATSLLLADAVGPSGKVVGVDISAPMLARARERAARVSNLSLLESDASVATFAEPFDLLFSRFGVMFFPEPHKAFAHLRGLLAPNGRLAFACWQSLRENEWGRAPLEAFASMFPITPPKDPFAPGPFAFASPDRVREILQHAGFQSIEIVPYAQPMVFSETGVDHAVDFAVNLGPAARFIAELDESNRPQVRDALRTLMSSRVKDGGRVEFDACTWVVTAVNG